MLTLNKVTEINIEIGILDYLESAIPFSTKQKNSKIFFLDIIDYNKNKDTYGDFFKYPHNENQSYLLVKRTRLNKILEQYQYRVNSVFEIVQLKSLTFEYMIVEALSKIKLIDIKSFKLFDSFDSKQKKYLYDNDNVSKLISSLVKNKCEVNCLSIINDNASNNFYKELLKNNSVYTNLKIKYMRQPIILNSPIIYILIKDTSNQNYIFYFDERINWKLLTSEKDLIEFSPKFYTLLNSRFDYLFKDSELENKNYTLSINKETFYDDFSDGINFLFNEITLISDQKNLQENEINLKINNLIKILLRLKISFPKMNYNYKILYHFIRLLETSLILNTTRELGNTRGVIESLINSELFNKINNMLMDASSKEEFLLKPYLITNKNLADIRTQLFTLTLNGKDLILDIFNNLCWNDKTTIIESFNIILGENDYVKRLVNISLKLKNKNELHKLNDIVFYKFIARIIINFYLCSNKIIIDYELSKKEIKILESLEMTSPQINDMYKIFFKQWYIN